jgi:hypothetical protein
MFRYLSIRYRRDLHDKLKRRVAVSRHRRYSHSGTFLDVGIFRRRHHVFPASRMSREPGAGKLKTVDEGGPTPVPMSRAESMPPGNAPGGASLRIGAAQSNSLRVHMLRAW